MRNTLRYAPALAALFFVTACGEDTPADSPEPGDAAPDTGIETDVAPSPTDDTEVTGEDTASVTPGTPCSYPPATGAGYALGFGRTIPDIYWEPAYRSDGTSFRFDLYDFYCSPEYEQYDTLAVVVSAGWCPQCPRLIDWVDRLGPRLEQEGALVLFVEGQNERYAEASSESARQHFARHTQTNGTGIRVGDAAATPRNAIAASPLIRAFPSSFIVRKRDMVMIVESSMSNYILPYVEVAMDPEADWSRPPAPTIAPTYPSNCGPDDEEPFEPNDTAAQAGPLNPGDVIVGGICDIEPDFYRIEHDGPWRLRLEFNTNEGDLDVYVWDVERDRPVTTPDGRALGSNTYESVEEFDHAGPATIYIHGYQGATTTYVLRLTAL
jgi:predicted small lipoprotein YifL